MATKEEVEKFLNEFLTKISIYDIFFRNDRNKNTNALFELDITPNYRKEVIKSLTVEDYSDGAIVDTLNNYGEMWVFGKDVKGHEVYIKIALLKIGGICISFHKAERKLHYPLKSK